MTHRDHVSSCLYLHSPPPPPPPPICNPPFSIRLDWVPPPNGTEKNLVNFSHAADRSIQCGLAPALGTLADFHATHGSLSQYTVYMGTRYTPSYGVHSRHWFLEYTKHRVHGCTLHGTPPGYWVHDTLGTWLVTWYPGYVRRWYVKYTKHRVRGYTVHHHWVHESLGTWLHSTSGTWDIVWL
jgi:hypothetical protein